MDIDVFLGVSVFWVFFESFCMICVVFFGKYFVVCVCVCVCIKCLFGDSEANLFIGLKSYIFKRGVFYLRFKVIVVVPISVIYIGLRIPNLL